MIEKGKDMVAIFDDSLLQSLTNFPGPMIREFDIQNSKNH